MKTVTTLDDFLKHVKSGRDTFVKISTTTCGPCKMMLPIFTKLAEENEHFGKVFVEVSLDAVDKTFQDFLQKDLGIRQVPTFLVYNQGNLSINFTGAVPASKLKEKLKL